MGCTPSVLNTGTEAGSTGGLINHQQETPTLTAATSSPRSWRFRKTRPEKLSSPAKNSSTISDRQQSDGKESPHLKAGGQKTQLKVLLAFPRGDAQSDTLWLAADRLSCEVCLARGTHEALEAYQDKAHEVVIIDARNNSHKFDGTSLCKAIRSQLTGQNTLIAAVVKKGVFEKDEATVIPYINIGYNRIICETSTVGQCMNELLQLNGEVNLRYQFTITQAFQICVEKSKDIVYITDHNHKVKYANKASEKSMGYTMTEMGEKTLLDFYHIDQKELMTQQLIRGREWEGMCVCRRKQGESMVAHCRVIPVNVPGKVPTHYVYITDSPINNRLANKRFSEASAGVTVNTTSVREQPSQVPRGSIHSLRKGSLDVKSINSDAASFVGSLTKKEPLSYRSSSIFSPRKGSLDVRSINSDGTRRQSIARLHSLSIEGPITKVITLLTAAQENSSAQVVLLIDKVIDILRSTELYSPLMREDKIRSADSVTNDLIGALLSQGGTSLSVTRRSSNDSAASRLTQTPGSRSATKLFTMTAQMKSLLDTALLWDFNIFRLEEISGKRPLAFLGMNLMCHFDVFSTLGCDEATMYNWLVVIEMNYRSSNSYHNSTHAADVLQASAGYLERERLKQIMVPMDEASCLIAAAVHDVDHPGKSSAFLCNSGDELAIMYNDICVLESHHAALSFKLALTDDRLNIFKGLERDVYKQLRHSIIDMVLATEMTKHYEHLAKFVNMFGKSRDEDGSSEVGSNSPDHGIASTPENVVLIKRMLIKCADVSNPMRPLRLCVEWACRIAQEYFNQTDEEKANGLPVVMPMFDRNTCSIPRSQIGFMEFIISDMAEAWDAFIEMPEMIENMDNNYKYWKEKEDMGITTIEEISVLQGTRLYEETSVN